MQTGTARNATSDKTETPRIPKDRGASESLAAKQKPGGKRSRREDYSSFTAANDGDGCGIGCGW
jgi:hypothetical protein